MPTPEAVHAAAPDAAVREVEVWAHDGDCQYVTDTVAVEAPLEVRLDGRPFAVIMRTPGDDDALALGFLLTEAVLSDPADVVGLSQDAEGHWVDIRVAARRARDVAARLDGRRRVTTSSSCGMCGRASLESLQVSLPPVSNDWRWPASRVTALPARLAEAQAAFRITGGLHAAALFDRDGGLLCSAEDVGRHNAVDKLLGRRWRAGSLPLRDAILMVSGRTSFEIVQKAWYGGVPIVAAVSAPSSLAIDLAHQAGITLLGFVRNQRFNVYAHPERIDGDS